MGGPGWLSWGQGVSRAKLAKARLGHQAEYRLTSLRSTEILLQFHTLELQGVQLALDVLHLPLDLLWGHVVRGQLWTEGW